MRPALVVKPNPVTDDSIGMLQGLKPLTMNTLLFQGSDYTLDHPVLLGTVRRDELLFQTVASDQGCEASVKALNVRKVKKSGFVILFIQSFSLK